jgi:hypothetical protein
MAIESEESLAIREIVMSDVKDIPTKAKIAREALGIIFPPNFVERLIAIKLEDEDRLRCNNKHCCLTLDRIRWKNYLSSDEYRCPSCGLLQVKLKDGRRGPQWIFGKIHEVCEMSSPKFKLGMTAMDRATDCFNSAVEIMHKVQEDLGRLVMEGGEIPDKDE